MDYLDKYYEGDIKKAYKLFNEGLSVQYIVGNVDFYGNKILVDSNVLIPRFETELLVEKVYELFKGKKITIVDIGTGSGCVAISLKKLLDCYMCAVDVSTSALELAKKNALLNNVSINFIESNIFSNLSEKFDCIVSNPPYISYDEKIQNEVFNNEPHLALFASDSGLYFYKKIIDECQMYLNTNGYLVFEIGYLQAADITLYAQEKLNCIVNVYKDYSNKDRILIIKML